MGIPRTLRDSQARWKSLFLDFSRAHLFHSWFCWVVIGWGNRNALGGIASQAVGPVGETDTSLQVLMNRDLAASQSPSPVHPFNLQSEILKADGVVPVYSALELKREDQVQVFAPTRDKGRPALCRRHLKTPIKLGDVVLAQKAVGLFHRLDSPQS